MAGVLEEGDGMKPQRLFTFLRITFQGIAIASLGTLGVSPSWGGLLLGIMKFFLAFVLFTFEAEE